MPAADIARLVLGTAALGLAYGLPRRGNPRAELPDETRVAAVLTTAAQVGIPTVDTAPAYGSAEERIGAAWRGGVWTKLDDRLRLGPSLAEEAVASAAASRQRLGRIDLLQWHNWTAAVGRDPAFAAACDHLRGITLGATTYGVADAVAAVQCRRFAVVQVEWNLLNRASAQAGLQHKTANVRLAVRSVLLQGILSDELATLPAHLNALVPWRDQLIAIAAECGLTLSQLALRAALDLSGADHVLIGCDQPEQVRAAAAIAAGPALPDTILATLLHLRIPAGLPVDPRAWTKAESRTT